MTEILPPKSLTFITVNIIAIVIIVISDVIVDVVNIVSLLLPAL